jgi:cytochrome c551
MAYRTTVTGCIFALLLLACHSKKEDTGNTPDTSIKFKQYFIKGEQLYLKHCSNCHQKDGTGLGLLYPPLNQSDYMRTHFEAVICLIKNGTEGPISVNGKVYNKPMPATLGLTDLEIAEIATYIYNTGEHNRGLIDVKTTSSILSSCGGE